MNETRRHQIGNFLAAMIELFDEHTHLTVTVSDLQSIVTEQENEIHRLEDEVARLTRMTEGFDVADDGSLYRPRHATPPAGAGSGPGRVPAATLSVPEAPAGLLDAVGGASDDPLRGP